MGCSASKKGDSNSFSAAIRNGVIPSIDQHKLNHESVLNEHYYQIQPETQKLVSLETGFAMTQNYLLMKNQKDLWAACFLKSKKDGQERGLQPIELAVVLDTSDSTKEHDGSLKRQLILSQFIIAEIIQNSLRQEDSFGLGIFNEEGCILTEMTQMIDVDKENLGKAIKDIEIIPGKTCIKEGIKLGIELLVNQKNQEQKYDQNQVKKDTDLKNKTQKRILLISNLQDSAGEEVDEYIRKAAEQNIYTSVIGVGTDFNQVLAEKITKHRGANYFSVTNIVEVSKIFKSDFDFNFFPIAFNVSLKMNSSEFEIDKIYGTSYQTEFVKTMHQEKELTAITEINTLFPSQISKNEDQIKGGLILIKIKPKKQQNNMLPKEIEFELSYTENACEKTDENTKRFTEKLDIQLLHKDEEHNNIVYSNGSIRKE